MSGGERFRPMNYKKNYWKKGGGSRGFGGNKNWTLGEERVENEYFLPKNI